MTIITKKQFQLKNRWHVHEPKDEISIQQRPASSAILTRKTSKEWIKHLYNCKKPWVVRSFTKAISTVHFVLFPLKKTSFTVDVFSNTADQRSVSLRQIFQTPFITSNPFQGATIRDFQLFFNVAVQTNAPTLLKFLGHNFPNELSLEKLRFKLKLFGLIQISEEDRLQCLTSFCFLLTMRPAKTYCTFWWHANTKRYEGSQ